MGQVDVPQCRQAGLCKKRAKRARSLFIFVLAVFCSLFAIWSHRVYCVPSTTTRPCPRPCPSKFPLSFWAARHSSTSCLCRRSLIETVCRSSVALSFFPLHSPLSFSLANPTFSHAQPTSTLSLPHHFLPTNFPASQTVYQPGATYHFHPRDNPPTPPWPPSRSATRCCRQGWSRT